MLPLKDVAEVPVVTGVGSGRVLARVHQSKFFVSKAAANNIVIRNASTVDANGESVDSDSSSTPHPPPPPKSQHKTPTGAVVPNQGGKGKTTKRIHVRSKSSTPSDASSPPPTRKSKSKRKRKQQGSLEPDAHQAGDAAHLFEDEDNDAVGPPTKKRRLERSMKKACRERSAVQGAGTGEKRKQLASDDEGTADQERPIANLPRRKR